MTRACKLQPGALRIHSPAAPRPPPSDIIADPARALFHAPHVALPMERWRAWGLSPEEWECCVEAARELRELHPPGGAPTAEQIAAQLAVAKAAEEPEPAGFGQRVPVR